MYKIWLLLPSFIILLLFVSPAQASEDFSDYYNVTYRVDKEGKTTVNQNISIVNNTISTYAADYTITIGSEKIQNVSASDQVGSLTPEITSKDGVTSIRVVFKDKVVGAKRALNWNLSYTVSDVANKHGTVWEVTIPRLSPQPEIQTYDLSVYVPKSFGPQMYISPKAVASSENDNEYVYSFKKDEFENTGVMAAFGNAQRYSLDLTYHLKNPSFLSSSVEIALPPDIYGEQQLEIERVEPKPASIRIDEDGNYLARYLLKPQEEKVVSFTAKVLVFHRVADLNNSGNISEVPENLRTIYTRAEKFWDSDDFEIKTLAAGIVQKSLNAAENARRLYQYVVGTLKYDWSAVNKGSGLQRKGAKAILQNPEEAVCMEYADLLIALLRSSGIPARRAAGYAYSQNYETQPVPEDTLHTWVQLYLPKIGWISADPTWGSTTNGLDYFSKLDTNHVVFSINGRNSEFPFPAGTYKIKPDQKGDLKISFIEDQQFFPVDPQLTVFQKEGSLFVLNSLQTAGTAALDAEVRIIGEKNNQDLFLGTLPVYSENKITNVVFEEKPLKVNITYKKFDGSLISNDFSINLKPVSEDVKLKINFFQILLLVLFLCMIFGFSLTVGGFRKKLLNLLHYHPRVPNQ